MSAFLTGIPAVLSESAKRWPEAVALREAGGAITFAQLERESVQFADRLASAGLRPGDTVLVFVPMSISLYVTLLGVFRLGAVAMFVEPWAGPGHVGACCRLAPPNGMVAGAVLRVARLAVPALRRIPHVVSPPGRARRFRARLTLPGPARLDDPALITFTSGSTGEPKAAVRTHGFLLAQHRALESAISLRPGEIDLTTLPVFVLANLASGVTSVLPDADMRRPGAVDARRVARQIAQTRPSRTGGSPAFYERLLGQPGAMAGFRRVFTGGAPVFPALLRRLQDALPGGDAVAVYGSTEAEPIAHIACREILPEDWEAMAAGRGLLAGRPVPEIRLRILPDQWGANVSEFAELPAGATGEIVVTGAHVLKGYLRGRGDGETKIQIAGETWHRTGDAGWLDAQGRLWLMGRCAARFPRGGTTIYPFAVECVAMSFDFVERAACLHAGDRAILAVQAPHANDAEIESLRRAAGPLVDDVWTLPEIPVDSRHNAKVNYPRLREILSRRR